MVKKLCRLYGADAIAPLLPPADQPLLAYLARMGARASRRRLEGQAAAAEAAAAGGGGGARSKGFDSLIGDDDSDGDDGNDDDGPGGGGGGGDSDEDGGMHDGASTFGGTECPVEAGIVAFGD